MLRFLTYKAGKTSSSDASLALYSGSVQRLLGLYGLHCGIPAAAEGLQDHLRVDPLPPDGPLQVLRHHPPTSNTPHHDLGVLGAEVAGLALPIIVQVVGELPREGPSHSQGMPSVRSTQIPYSVTNITNLSNLGWPVAHRLNRQSPSSGDIRTRLNQRRQSIFPEFMGDFLAEKITEKDGCHRKLAAGVTGRGHDHPCRQDSREDAGRHPARRRRRPGGCRYGQQEMLGGGPCRHSAAALTWRDPPALSNRDIRVAEIRVFRNSGTGHDADHVRFHA